MFSNLPDLAKRAFHAFWQSFVGLTVAGLSVGGVSLSGIHSLSDVKAALGVVIAILVAAAASALKTTIVANLGGFNISDGMGPGTTQPLPVVDTVRTPVPADPGQPAAGVPPAPTGA